jgi:hypothetical protein
MKSKWGQLMYTYPNFSGKTSSYDVCKGITEIIRIEPLLYYNHKALSIATSDSLTLPNNIEVSLDLVFSLAEDEWNKLLKACTWVDKAQAVHHESNSLAFIGYVNAVEALIEKPKKQERCSKCNKELQGPTVHFKSFIKEFVPFIDEFTEEKRIIYQIRSDLNHGLDILENDLHPWKFMMSKKAENEYHIQRNLHFIVLTAVRNWLWSKGSRKEAVPDTGE